MKKILLLVLMLFSIMASAQNRVVRGVVLDASRCPIKDASVAAEGVSEKFVSGEDGSFQITIPSYSRKITASKESFTSVTLEVDGSYLVFTLKPDAKLKAAEKNIEYDQKFKNKGITFSVDASYAYQFSRDEVYTKSGWIQIGNLHPIDIDFTIKYKFNCIFSLGIGAGCCFFDLRLNKKAYLEDDVYGNNMQEALYGWRLDVPVFASFDIHLLRTAVRPFFCLKGGFYILSNVPLAEAGIGCQYRYGKKNGAFHIMASMKTTPWPYIYYDKISKYFMDYSLCFTVGVDF